MHEADLTARPKAPGRRGARRGRARPKPSSGSMKGLGDDDDAPKPDAAVAKAKKEKALKAHEAKKAVDAAVAVEKQSQKDGSKMGTRSPSGWRVCCVAVGLSV